MNVGMLSACETNESGFRFVCIELLEEEGMVQFKAVQGVFHYPDLDYVGSFSCSDEKLNRIRDTAAYTAHLNMQEFLWDGIKRDRLVRIGDMHTEVNTIPTAFGYNDIVPRSLDVVRDETPVGNWMNGISSYSIWWLRSTATGTAPLATGTTWSSSTLPAGAYDGYGWLCGRGRRGAYAGETLLGLPNDADPAAIHAGLQGMLRLALTKGAELLRVLGEDETAALCEAAAARMLQHVPDCHGSKQAAALLSLSGLADPKAINADVLTPGGGHGYSTFFGYYILAAKALAGDYAGALADMKQYWGGMLDMGATTFWEDFNADWMNNAGRIDEVVPEGKIDIHGDYGAYCYIRFRHSLCHGWASGPCPYLSNYVLGIRNLAPGKYEVKPELADLGGQRAPIPPRRARCPSGLSATKRAKRSSRSTRLPESRSCGKGAFCAGAGRRGTSCRRSPVPRSFPVLFLSGADTGTDFFGTEHFPSAEDIYAMYAKK